MGTSIEREAMTERQAFEKFWGERMRNVPPQGPVPTPKELSYEAWQAAIANLSRAAEPVAFRWLMPLWPNACAWTRWHDIGSQPVPTDCKVEYAYTHPPEPARDAKDAARYRWLRDTQTTFGKSARYDDSGAPLFYVRLHGYGTIPANVDASIDAAMARESGDAIGDKS